jgi:hypothetical protein
MWKQLFACYASVGACFCALHVAAAADPVRVELASDSQEYVIGEPVVLSVTVTNVSQDEIQVLVDALDYHIGILISQDGTRFKQYTPGDRFIPYVIPRAEPLGPGESKVHTFRVLYTSYSRETPQRRSHLVFEKPGMYLVKARYPLFGKRESFESNMIRVRINQPQGVDAEVWKQINSPHFLYFLRSAEPNSVLRDYGDTPLRAARLLQSIPKSSYSPAIKYALERRYRERRRYMLRERALEDPELQLIRSVTGIEEPPEGPFPDDRRLDVQISSHFPELTPLDEVCRQISRQGGVTLTVAPELRIRRMKRAPLTESLRRFMASLSGGGRTAKWIRDGDGYRLVPLPQPEAQPLAQRKP